MKSNLLSLLLSLVAVGASAQYAIVRAQITGGGGTSTNGQFSMIGTMGHLDAGTSVTNGPYALAGGFWNVTLVPTPDAPTLHLTNAAPGWITIWWTPPTSGYVLQSSDGLSPAAWANTPSGTNNPVTVPTAGLARFYRLAKP